MKFRDPNTGTVYDSIGNAWLYWDCGKSRRCKTGSEDQRACKFANTLCRPSWCHDHPAEAAKLMGYEIIEEEKPMENKKPRICELLGVEVGEKFEIEEFGGVVFWMLSDGTFATEPTRVTNSTNALLRAIEHPERIIRKPRWTQEDVEDAKAIMRVTGMVWAGRDEDGELWAYAEEPILVDNTFESRKNYIWMRSSILPSLAHGEKVKLEDILAQVPHV